MVGEGDVEEPDEEPERLPARALVEGSERAVQQALVLLGRGDGRRVRDVLDELRLEGLEEAAFAADRLARVGFDASLDSERRGREVEGAGENVEFGEFEELAEDAGSSAGEVEDTGGNVGTDLHRAADKGRLVVCEGTREVDFWSAGCW